MTHTPPVNQLPFTLIVHFIVRKYYCLETKKTLDKPGFFIDKALRLSNI